MSGPRIDRVIGAVNLGSFRISAMIAGLTETGELIVLGSAHRAAQGLKRGFVTDMAAATYAVRDAIERAEKIAQTNVDAVLVGTAGAGLASQVAHVEIDVGGRRIEQDDIAQLMLAGRDVIQPDGRLVLHAQPAHYTLDGAHGVANPRGLHAERLGVDIHVMLADGAPVRNLTEAVRNQLIKHGLNIPYPQRDLHVYHRDADGRPIADILLRGIADDGDVARPAKATPSPG